MTVGVPLLDGMIGVLILASLGEGPDLDEGPGVTRVAPNEGPADAAGIGLVP